MSKKGIALFLAFLMLFSIFTPQMTTYAATTENIEEEKLQLEIVRPLLLPELVGESEQLQWQYRLFDIFRCREKQLVIFR